MLERDSENVLYASRLHRNCSGQTKIALVKLNPKGRPKSSLFPVIEVTFCWLVEIDQRPVALPYALTFVVPFFKRRVKCKEDTFFAKKAFERMLNGKRHSAVKYELWMRRAFLVLKLVPSSPPAFKVMRFFTSLVFLLFSIVGSFAQTTTWTGAIDYDFNKLGNWTFNVPVNGSTVVIPGDIASPIVGIPALSLNGLTINGNCIFEAGVTGSTLTVTGIFSVSSGKTFAIGTNTGRFNFLLASSSIGTIDGTVLISSGVSPQNFQNDGSLAVSSTGTITDDGASNPSNFILSPGGTLKIGSPQGISTSGTMGNIRVSGTRTYSTTAYYAYVGNVSQSVGNGLPSVVENLEINNTGGTVSLAFPITITNSLRVLNGTLDIGGNNILSVNAIFMNGTTINGSGTINLNGAINSLAKPTTAIINPPISIGSSDRVFNVAIGGSSSDLLVNSVISGTGGIIKSGVGILTLAGTNSFSGVTQINTGMLQLGAAGSAGNGPLGTTASNTVVANNAILNLNGFTLTNSEPLTINGSGIAGIGALTNSGANASYSGLITLASNAAIASTAGTIAITNVGPIGGSGSLTLQGSSGGVVTSVIGPGVSSVIKSGSGTWTLEGSNTFTGGVTLNAGVLNINNANALGSAAGTFTINGGSFDNTSGGAIATANYPMTWNGDFAFLGSNSLDLGNGSVFLSGNRSISTSGFGLLRIRGIINAPASLTKNGSGILIISDNQITLNNLTISGGIFVAPSSAINLSGDLVVGAASFINNGGTVNFNGSVPQAVAGVVFQNVNFSGFGQKNATGNIVVNSTATNTSVLNLGAKTLNAGAINNTGGTVQFGGIANGFAINTGTVVYNGPSQTVGAGTYNNLTISQSSGEAGLAAATTVNNILNLTSGNLNVGTNVLTLGTASTVLGASLFRFIIATGGGEVRKVYAGPGSFTFPIGDNSGVTEFSPITLNVTSGTGFPSFVSASVTDLKHPNNSSPTDFLTRFWNLTTGVTSAVASINANYPSASISGTETSISAGVLRGVFNRTTNPWIKFGSLSANSLSIATTTINSGQNIITGIIRSSPSATAGVNKSLCNSETSILGGAPTAFGGAGGYTYSWTPSSGLGSVTVANPVFTASSTGTTAYTVVVTDANGFVSSGSTVDVSVTALPTPTISGPANVCAGQSNVVYSTPSNANRAYFWSVTGGSFVGANNTAAVAVNWGGVGLGQLWLTETIIATGCSVTTPFYDVAINSVPIPAIDPGTFSTVCAGQSGTTYTTANSGNIFNWAVTNGTITAGAGTNSITVTWNTTGAGGSVDLTELTLAGCSVLVSSAVTFNPLPSPGISGSNSACAGQTINYSTFANSGRTYFWTVTGGSFVGGINNAANVSVNWGVAGVGQLQLVETINATGCSRTTPIYSVTVNPTPAIPSISAAFSSVCPGQSGTTYSIAASGNAYSWVVVNGIITSGNGTNSITVDWNNTGVSGSVQVIETNGAGCTSSGSKSIILNSLPNPVISGSSSVCAGNLNIAYSTPLNAGRTYLWTVSGGAFVGGVNNTASVLVNWAGAGSGQLQLVETIILTGCSVTTPFYSVSINANPNPIITSTFPIVCAGAGGTTYSTSSTGNIYNWSVTNGIITGGAGTNTITVLWNATGASGSVQLTEATLAGCSVIATPYPVTINPVPAPAISGSNNVCANQSGVVYSTPSSGTLVWSITNGTITSGAGTPVITVTWGAFGSGTLQVTENLPSGCSVTTALYNVVINPRPVPIITGPTSICENTNNVSYSIPGVAGRTYSWSVASGGLIIGSSTGTSILVNWGTAGSGSLQVTEIITFTGCNTTTSPYNVTINPNPLPVISGLNTVCANQLGVTYSVTDVALHSYAWVVTGTGSSIVSGQNTASIVVNWGTGTSGTVQVTQTSGAPASCPTTVSNSVTINPLPAPSITGSATVCSGQGSVIYSTPLVGGRNYSWAVTGATSFTGGSTNSITVLWGAAGAGSVQVTETLAAAPFCSVTTSAYPVTINAIPTPSITTTTGTASACVGQSFTYGTTLVSGNTYAWSLPAGGGTITPPTSGIDVNQVTINWNVTGARSVRVTETLASTGCSVNSSNYNVTVVANPNPVISGSNSVCANQSGVVYSRPAVGGRTFSWSVTGATSFTGGSTNAITVTWGAAGPGTVQLTETLIAAPFCSTTTSAYNVTIKPNPTPIIAGPTLFCTNQPGANYSTTLVGGNTYSWAISGGTITSGALTNAPTVTWGAPGAGTLTLTETQAGCIVVTAPYDVSIVSNPTPSITGSNTVCENQTSVPYSTPTASGRTYVWTVIGGSIASGSGTAAITVNWGTAGAGSVQLTETITAGSCSFTTPALIVTKNARPTPAISGPNSVCANQANANYTTPGSGNIYIWTISGGSIVSGAGTSSIFVNWGSAGIGSIGLTEISVTTGCVASTTLNSITIKAIPSPTISGNNTVCAGDLGKTYSVPVVAGDSYSWAVTGGTINGSSTNNSVAIDWGTSASGTLQVTVINSLGCSFITPSYNVFINPRPLPTITGLATVCANQTGVNYSTGASGNSFLWSVSGGSITAGAGTASITVNWNSAGMGMVSLVETNPSTGCSASAIPASVTINPKPTTTIVGSNSVCALEQNKPYFTTLVAGNTYVWSVTGGTIDGPSNGNSVVIDWLGTGVGVVSLTETNPSGCFTTIAAYNVTINPTPTPSVTGLTSVCANQAGVGYSTPNVLGDFYAWAVTGGSIISGVGTNAIVVDWGTTGVGTVSITQFIPASGCSVSPPSTAITINANPTPVIAGSNTVCASALNKVYGTALVVGNTYNWVVTGGTINGSSTGNSIIVDWGSAGLGTVRLTEQNPSTCTVVTPVYHVNINNLPTPSISGPPTACALQTGVIYSTANVPGNSYTWSVTGGSVISGNGTSSIVVNWGLSGTGSITLTEFIPSSSCLTTTAPYPITINPIPTPAITGNNAVCANDAGRIYTTPFVPGNTYLWAVTGGTIVGASTANAVTVVWGAAGSGTLTVTESAGCSASTPIYNVTIRSNPTPMIIGSTAVCANELGLVYSTTNVVGNNYFWSVSGGTIVSGAGTSSITVNWAAAGTGVVILTETIASSGCAVMTPSTIVAISPGALVNAGVDIETCFGIPVNLSLRSAGVATASNFASLSWSGGTGSFSNNSIANPIYTPGPLETGLVTLTLSATGSGTCPVVADQLVLTITPLPLVNAGSDAEVCEGTVFGFFTQTTPASASGFSSVLWTKSGGTGTIFNANTLAPSYQPGIGEIGVVTFTLTVNSTGSCSPLTDNMLLTITPKPIVNSGIDKETCGGVAIDLSLRGVGNVASASSFNTILWSGGTGSFSNTGSLNPVYTPGAGETGVVLLTVAAAGIGSCAAVTEQMILTVTPPVVVNAGSNAATCQGASINFGARTTVATASGFNTLTWTGGAGTLVNANTLNPTYNPTAGETGVITFTLTATSSGSCATNTSTMQLTITPKPIVNAGSDQEVCRGTIFNFSTQTTPASASDFNTITWTTAGSGTFTNTTTLTPSYVASIAESGPITFTLTATGNGSCLAVTDQMVLNVSPGPVANAGSNEEICQGVLFDFATQSTPASVSNFSNLLWTHNGSGTLLSPNSILPVYQSALAETGVITFTLTVNGLGSCLPVVSTMLLTKRPLVSVNAGTNAETCEGAPFNFSTRFITATATNFTSLLWTHTGTGALANATTLSPIYVPGVGETGNVTFTLTANGIGVCPSKQSQMTLSITPVVTVDAGSNLSICQGSSINFATQTTLASATNFSSVLWTHTGAGSLFNTTSLTPTYFASAAETGNVTFTLRVFSIGSCASVTDVTSMNIVPAPLIHAGADAEVCEGLPTFSFSSRAIPASSANGAILWTHNGFGTLSSSALINPVYTLSPLDFGNQVTFTLTITSGVAVCSPVQDQFILKVNRKAIVSLPPNYTVCETAAIPLTGTIGGTATTALWTILTGTGTLSASNVTGLTVTSNYNVSPADIGTTVTFRLTSNDPDGPTSPCTTEFADISVTINRAVSISAGVDIAQCSNQTSIALQGVAAYAPAGVSWSGGLGSFFSGSSPTGSYRFSNPLEISSTSPVTLILTGNDPDGAGPCTSVTDQMKLTINPLPVVSFFGLPPSRAENQPAIPLDGTQSGGVFSISPATSNIGSTIPSPFFDRAFFNPKAVTLGFNTVTYTYTNPVNGCTNSSSQVISVNPVTVIDFKLQYQIGPQPFPFVPIDSAGFFALCANVGFVKIVGTPRVSTGLSPTNFAAVGPNSAVLAPRIAVIGSDFFIDTDGLPSDTYSIEYTYTDIGGTSDPLVQSFKVFSSPTASILTTSNCVESAIPLTGSVVLPPSPFPLSTIATWSWDTDDNTGVKIGQNISHIYTTADIYDIALTVTTTRGCSNTVKKSIRVGDVPKVNFEWSSICTNSVTQFVDRTTNVLPVTPTAISTIVNYTWDFGDLTPHSSGIGSTFKDPTHVYSSPGPKMVKLTVTTDDGCSKNLEQRVTIANSGPNVTPSLTTPYLNNFDNLIDNDWFGEAKIVSPPGTIPPVFSGNSWLRETPSGSTINSAASGVNAWWTGKKVKADKSALTPFPSYYPNEASWVNGPCFDLRQLNRPMVALDYWSDAESNADGAVLQYSTDGGFNWQIVGPLAGLPATQRDQGINWYDKDAVIQANPGQQPSFGPYGWTGKTGKWKNARFNLDLVDPLKRRQVRLRVAFSSNSGNPQLLPNFDGFAFDNFFVGEKERIVLLEHFTNSSLQGSKDADLYLNNLYDNDIALRGVAGNDFNNIQYHIGFESAKSDPLNADNPNDPNARASSYGVSQPPKTFIDGLKNQKLDGTTTKLTNVEIDRRALKAPKFKLRLDTTATTGVNRENLINVRLTMVADTIVNTPLIAQVALVEDNVVTPGGRFKNVLRKLLFGSDPTKPDGITITQTFTVGQSAVRPGQPATDVEINVPISNPNNLKLIGFVQDRSTGEIYQSTILKVKRKVGSVVVGLEEEPLAVMNFKDLQIFPNPANGKFNFGYHGSFPDGYIWKIADQRGIFVLTGDFTGAVNGIKSIDVSTITNGVYYVLIGAEGKVPVYRKLVVMNQN